jgi:hypothetical protein
MNLKERIVIYDRLLAIKIKLDASTIPDPKYINQKIGECHAYMEEVEHTSIDVSRETSVLEQAYNNAVAAYESKREELLSRDAIQSLPNIRDREARANQHLKIEIERIRDYKNELTAMVRLEKDLHVKMKNLDRVNKDIKSLQRVMESQMRLMSNAPSGVDMATKSLIDEFKKSMSNTDSFANSSTTTSEEQIVDPTTPLDVNNLLTEDISEKTIDPTPDIAPTEQAIESQEPEFKTVEVQETIVAPVSAPEEVVEEPEIEEDIEPQVDVQAVETIEEKPEVVIDLNAIIDFKKVESKKVAETKQEGGPIKEKPVETKKVKDAEPQHKEVRETKIGIDIDDLLDNLKL